MRGNYFKKCIACILSIICVVSGLIWNLKQKEKSALKVEISVTGKFDQYVHSLNFTEVSTGEIAMVEKGLCLIDDQEIYSILNPSEFFFEHGDSVYVVNHRVYPKFPDEKQLVKPIEKVLIASKVTFCISITLLIGMLFAFYKQF